MTPVLALGLGTALAACTGERIFGSELAHPPTHDKKNMPFMLAGGGGLEGGRVLDFGGRAHNALLVSILNLFGDAGTSYGHAESNSGALKGLAG